MKKLLSVCLILLMWVGLSAAATIGDTLDVSIVTDNGRSIPFYTAKVRHDLKKVYAEAVKGDHYRIVVRNKLNRRVGVVIAVDGRNIISGKKSWLKNTERMYVIDPYSTNEFSGWRSAQDKVNRFYFTDVPDSYAAAFGDESAMGVIALAVFPEIQRHQPIRNDSVFRSPNELMRDKSAPSLQDKAKASESAGTGYGREEYSPSYSVQFDPEKKAVESILIKYEWRKTLCKMNIIPCYGTGEYSGNRLWENDGYAPPPPSRR
jgi:hypothetical protein